MKRTRQWMLLSILLGISSGCAAARADEEHTHRCVDSGPPTFSKCCRAREAGRCTLWGKAACQPRMCRCGAGCYDVCTGCL